MKSAVKSRVQPSQINGIAYYRHLLSNRPHPLENLDALAAIVSFHRGQEICSEGQPVEHWYFLISGAARRCAIRSDGRRQIVDLCCPETFLACHLAINLTPQSRRWQENTVVASYPRPSIEILAESDPKIARELRQIAFTALSRMQTQLLILGRITASEKVGSFILEMAARLSEGESERVALPVSRYDIADYLGVSVETVSRALSDLKQRGAIKLFGTRTVSIIHRDLLEERARLES